MAIKRFVSIGMAAERVVHRALCSAESIQGFNKPSLAEIKTMSGGGSPGLGEEQPPEEDLGLLRCGEARRFCCNKMVAGMAKLQLIVHNVEHDAVNSESKVC